MVNIIGLGYIGLPTALMMSTHGVEVVGTDCDEKIISQLKNGEREFNEAGLETLYNDAVRAGIKFSTEYQKTNFYIISVPTPYIKDSKKVDTRYVVSAVKSVLEVCKKGTIIVIESTISPGTTDKFIRPLVAQRGFEIGKDIFLAHAPERIIPGNMLYELRYNSRTIGADEESIAKKVEGVYSTFCKGEIIITDIRTAEMTKVIENTFRAVNIAFANELAKICRTEDMDVYETIRICNMHPRVNILNPGPGVGGHCIGVDPWFLVGDYPELTKVISSAMETNDGMPDYVISRIASIMKENGITDMSRVGLYGLTYKENVDDCRESPTLQLLARQETYLKPGMKVYDPFVTENIVDNQMHSLNEFIDSVDLVVVMVSHDEIKNNRDKLSGKIVLDCRNAIDMPNVYRL